MRTGPGVRYPIDWVFHRRALPIEIVAEFGTWRKIRDEQGAEGWVHRSMLSGKRTALTIGGANSAPKPCAAPPKATPRRSPSWSPACWSASSNATAPGAA